MKLADSLNKDRIERNEQILDHMLEYFIKTWAPKDERDALDFHIQLHRIVRATFNCAQEPYIKQLSALYATLPMPSYFLEKK